MHIDQNMHDQKITRWEPPAALLIATLAAIWVGYMARDMWFHADSWDFLVGRSLSDPTSLFRPHAGHLQVPAASLFAAASSLAGMDYWPWFYLPRLILYALMSLALWYRLRQRGVHPLLSLATLAMTGVLGSSGWQDPSTVGNPIVLGCAYLVAVMMDSEGGDDRRKWAVAVLVALSTFSTSLGLALAVGTIGAAMFSSGRRSRILIPAIVGTIPYVLWYVLIRTGRGVPISLTNPLPFLADIVLETAERLAFVSGVGAGIVAAALVGAVVWTATRMRLKSGDFVLILTAGAYLAMVFLVRISAGQASTEAGRYAQNLTLLIVPVVLVSFVGAPRLVSWVGAALVAASIAPNAAALQVGLDFWSTRAQTSRPVVEAAWTIITAGEPYGADHLIDPPRAGTLTADDLRSLPGWEFTEGTEMATALARFDLRAGLRGAARERRCDTVGGEWTVSADRVSAVLITPEEGDGVVSLRWDDAAGSGARDVRFRGRYVDGLWLSLVDHEGTLTVTTEAPTTVCRTVIERD